MASAGGKGKFFKDMNLTPSHCELRVNSAALGFWKGPGVGLQSSLNNPVTKTLAPNLELLLISQSPLSSLGGQERAAGSGNLGAWSLGRYQPHPDSVFRVDSRISRMCPCLQLPLLGQSVVQTQKMPLTGLFTTWGALVPGAKNWGHPEQGTGPRARNPESKNKQKTPVKQQVARAPSFHLSP